MALNKIDNKQRTKNKTKGGGGAQETPAPTKPYIAGNEFGPRSDLGAGAMRLGRNQSSAPSSLPAGTMLENDFDISVPDATLDAARAGGAKLAGEPTQTRKLTGGNVPTHPAFKK
jgi:hypothetical protein